MLKPRPSHRIRPRSVTVRVLNGTAVGGMQDTVAAALQQQGFKVAQTGIAASQSVNQTVIRYHAGQEDQARLVAGKLHGAAIQQVPGSGNISVLVGSDYGTTVHTGPGTTPQPSSTFAPRTATQNICT
jgi:LytR cell envelope-related transcriptional attenuator